MRTFTDSAGRAWTISITVGAVQRVQAGCAANLSMLDRPCAPGQPPLLEALQRDALVFAAALWHLVADQAGKLGLTREQFIESLDANCLPGALEAFWAELADFFRAWRPPPPAPPESPAQSPAASQAAEAVPTAVSTPSASPGNSPA